MHPAGDDVLGAGFDHTTAMSVGPLRRPDQCHAFDGSYLEAKEGKLGFSATLDIVQIGHPNEHPMSCRQGGPFGVQGTEMPTGIVFLNIESADVSPGQKSLQKIPLITVVLKALIEVLKIFGKYHVFLFFQIFWGDVDVQRLFGRGINGPSPYESGFLSRYIFIEIPNDSVA